MITISLCMIVKNEEAVLARCLESYHDLMDEIIIIDTGSTDKTKEIAKKYTDLVYDFKWTGEFDVARNFSFSKATKEYIFCADADEVLEPENRERFKQLKECLLPEIDIVQMYYKNQLSFNTIYNYDKEYRPKLYKRIRHFIWESPIHEAVRLDPIIYDSDVEILHLPTSLHTSRDLQAFEKMIAGNVPINKRLHEIYAKELFISGDEQALQNSIPYFVQKLNDTGSSEDALLEASCILAKAYYIQNEIPMFFKYTLKAISLNGCSEACCLLGDYYLSISDYEESSIYYYNAAFETESILSLKTKEYLPYLGLSTCYEKLGHKDVANDYLQMAEKSTFAMQRNK